MFAVQEALIRPKFVSMKHFFLFLGFFAAFSTLLPGQSNNGDKKKQVKELMYFERYNDALALLNGAKQMIRDDREAQLLAAICLFQVNQLDKAREYLSVLVENEQSDLPECWLYLAKVYHAQHQFAEASKYYKIYLRNIREDHEHRKMVIEEIRRCANGIDRQYHTNLAVVENLGPGINTPNDEFAPIPSPNFQDKLYFSSSRQGNMGGLRNRFGASDERLGHFCSDMFSATQTNGLWGQTSPFNYLLNSPRHEVLQDFSADGNVLYYFRGWEFNSGEIVIDTFKRKEDKLLSSTPFISPLNSIGGDVSFFLYQDSIIVFSSNRPGGLGGLDLYRVVLRNGQWTVPENLGAPVNTPFDETCPFLARDGRTLYFASNDSRKGLGGLDIFKSVYIASTRSWTDPANLGIPINSAGDDSFFRIAKDGSTAYFASSRKDGLGLRDIYVAYFPDYLVEMDAPPVVAPSKKTNQPVAASAGSDIMEFPAMFFSGSDEPLSSEHRATLAKIAKLLQQHPRLNVVLSAYPKQLTPPGAAVFGAIKQAEKAAAYLIQQGAPGTSVFMRGIHATPGKRGNLGVEFSFLGTRDSPVQGKVPIIGDRFVSVSPNLVVNKDFFYKIQVSSSKGAFQHEALSSFTDLMVEKTPNFEFYRYTLGAFQSFDEAEAYRKKLIAKGFSGAFVVPFINGIRADKDKVKQYLSIFPDLSNYLGQK